MSLPKFVDALKLIRYLHDNPNFKKMAGLIKQGSMAQSCLADIGMSESACSTLTDLQKSPRKRGTLERQTIESALLNNALLFYARATSTSGGYEERGSVQISESLTDLQKIDHDAIIEIRNKALAHVYPNGDISGEIWNKNILLFVEEDKSWRPVSVTKNTQFNENTFLQLKRQIPIAQKILNERFHKRLNALTSELNNNKIPIEVFNDNTINPLEVFECLTEN